MLHKEISLSEWNDTADALADLCDAVAEHGLTHVRDALSSIVMDMVSVEEQL